MSEEDAVEPQQEDGEVRKQATVQTLNRKAGLCLAALRKAGWRLESAEPNAAFDGTVSALHYQSEILKSQAMLLVRVARRGYVFAGLVFLEDLLTDARPIVGVVFLERQNAWFTTCVLSCTPTSTCLTDQLEIIRQLWGWEIIPTPRRLNQSQVVSALRLMADYLRQTR